MAADATPGTVTPEVEETNPAQQTPPAAAPETQPETAAPKSYGFGGMSPLVAASMQNAMNGAMGIGLPITGTFDKNSQEALAQHLMGLRGEEQADRPSLMTPKGRVNKVEVIKEFQRNAGFLDLNTVKDKAGHGMTEFEAHQFNAYNKEHGAAVKAYVNGTATDEQKAEIDALRAGPGNGVSRKQAIVNNAIAKTIDKIGNVPAADRAKVMEQLEKNQIVDGKIDVATNAAMEKYAQEVAAQHNVANNPQVDAFRPAGAPETSSINPTQPTPGPNGAVADTVADGPAPAQPAVQPNSGITAAAMATQAVAGQPAPQTDFPSQHANSGISAAVDASRQQEQVAAAAPMTAEEARRHAAVGATPVQHEPHTEASQHTTSGIAVAAAAGQAAANRQRELAAASQMTPAEQARHAAAEKTQEAALHAQDRATMSYRGDDKNISGVTSYTGYDAAAVTAAVETARAAAVKEDHANGATAAADNSTGAAREAALHKADQAAPVTSADQRAIDAEKLQNQMLAGETGNALGAVSDVGGMNDQFASAEDKKMQSKAAPLATGKVHNAISPEADLSSGFFTPDQAVAAGEGAYTNAAPTGAAAPAAVASQTPAAPAGHGNTSGIAAAAQSTHTAVPAAEETQPGGSSGIARAASATNNSRYAALNGGAGATTPGASAQTLRTENATGGTTQPGGLVVASVGEQAGPVEVQHEVPESKAPTAATTTPLPMRDPRKLAVAPGMS